MLIEVRAALDPQTLSRVVAPLAQRSITPREIVATRVEDHLLIAISLEGVDAHALEMIAAKVATMVLVDDVRLLDVHEAIRPKIEPDRAAAVSNLAVNDGSTPPSSRKPV